MKLTNNTQKNPTANFGMMAAASVMDIVDIIAVRRRRLDILISALQLTNRALHRKIMQC